jgi:hypothetical protein
MPLRLDASCLILVSSRPASAWPEPSSPFMPVETRILVAFHSCSGGFEADGEQELIEAGDYARIEPVKLGAADILQLCIGAEWAQDSGSQRSIDAFIKLQEHQADGVTMGK